MSNLNFLKSRPQNAKYVVIPFFSFKSLPTKPYLVLTVFHSHCTHYTPRTEVPNLIPQQFTDPKKLRTEALSLYLFEGFLTSFPNQLSIGSVCPQPISCALLQSRAGTGCGWPSPKSPYCIDLTSWERLGGKMKKPGRP